MKKPLSSHSALAAYYAAHRDKWVRVVQRQTLSQADGEDVVQDVFLRLLCNERVMVSETTLPGLVSFMICNRIRDYWRRRHSFEEFEHFIKSHAKTSGDDVASVYSAVELEQLLERGILQLRGRQQQICRLHICNGMGVREIADTLGQHYKSVENMLGVARKNIRMFMSRMWAS